MCILCLHFFFAVFCTVYAIDGLFREQKYEMLTYTGGVLVIVVYVISNYIDHGRNGEDIRLVSNMVVLHYCGFVLL